jgi:hypothetical protein
MPSSPGYIRNYKQEAAAESPARRHQREMRIQARRSFEKSLGRPIPPGMDVDHRKPLSKGGSNTTGNLGLQSAKTNRSYPRTHKGAMKSKYD